MLMACVVTAACGRANEHVDPCAHLGAMECGIAAAARAYADAPHAMVLVDPRFPAGVGIAREVAGDRATGAACARVDAAAPKVDVAKVDEAFLGVAIDATVVSSDADVAPLLARGDHHVSLVAIAVVHDDARGAIAPGAAIVGNGNGNGNGDACACGAATHVAGETLYGASLAYRTRAPRVDAPTRAIDSSRDAPCPIPTRRSSRRALASSRSRGSRRTSPGAPRVRPRFASRGPRRSRARSAPSKRRARAGSRRRVVHRASADGGRPRIEDAVARGVPLRVRLGRPGVVLDEELPADVGGLRGMGMKGGHLGLRACPSRPPR